MTHGYDECCSLVQLATLAQQHELREIELRQRMEGSEEVHRQSSNELRQLLAAQHRISSRYLLQYDILTSKQFETP